MKKILIIEDEQNLRELYELEFQGMGYEVLTAESAEDGLELVAKNDDINLIVLDIKLKGSDGLTTLEENMEKFKDRNIKVVINSAYSSYKDEFTSWAADAYIVKSADLNELKETVEKLLA